MGECYQCKYWDNSQWIMDKYGEGCGRCMQDGEIRFCSHKCILETPQEEDEVLQNGRRNY